MCDTQEPKHNINIKGGTRKERNGIVASFATGIQEKHVLELLTISFKYTLSNSSDPKFITH